jgi:hypothetical protein
MNNLGYTVSGFVFGALLGAGGAFALTPQAAAPKAAVENTVWTQYHAAIPAQPAKEEAPTF